MSKTVAAGQLSLWDMVEQDEKPADDLSYRDADFVPNALFPHMPEYVVKSHSWADGDTSPQALQRLAEVLLDIGVETFNDTGGGLYKYVAITTAVIGEQVWCAWQFQRKLARYIPQGKDDDLE